MFFLYSVLNVDIRGNNPTCTGKYVRLDDRFIKDAQTYLRSFQAERNARREFTKQFHEKERRLRELAQREENLFQAFFNRDYHSFAPEDQEELLSAKEILKIVGGILLVDIKCFDSLIKVVQIPLLDALMKTKKEYSEDEYYRVSDGICFYLKDLFSKFNSRAIKKNRWYKDVSLKFHPDKLSSSEANARLLGGEIFKLCNAIYNMPAGLY